jgi:hypothetical protein
LGWVVKHGGAARQLRQALQLLGGAVDAHANLAGAPRAFRLRARGAGARGGGVGEGGGGGDGTCRRAGGGGGWAGRGLQLQCSAAIGAIGWSEPSPPRAPALLLGRPCCCCRRATIAANSWVRSFTDAPPIMVPDWCGAAEGDCGECTLFSTHA